MEAFKQSLERTVYFLALIQDGKLRIQEFMYKTWRNADKELLDKIRMNLGL